MSNWEAWEISWGALLIFACTLMAHSGTLRFYHGLIGFFHFILDHTPTPLSSSMFLFLLYSRAVKGLWLGPQGGRFWGYLRPHSVGLGFSDPLLPLLAFAVSVARYRPSSPPSLFLWLGIGRRYLLVAPSLFSRLGIVRHHTPGPLAIVWRSSLVEHSLLDGKLVDESVWSKSWLALGASTLKGRCRSASICLLTSRVRREGFINGDGWSVRINIKGWDGVGKGWCGREVRTPEPQLSPFLLALHSGVPSGQSWGLVHDAPAAVARVIAFGYFDAPARWFLRGRRPIPPPLSSPQSQVTGGTPKEKCILVPRMAPSSLGGVFSSLVARFL
jgi:hypothetical protein